MAVSHLLLEHESTCQWPHSVPVSPGQNPYRDASGSSRGCTLWINMAFSPVLPKPFQVSMGNSL